MSNLARSVPLQPLELAGRTEMLVTGKAARIQQVSFAIILEKKKFRSWGRDNTLQ